MDHKGKTREELVKEVKELQKDYNSLKASYHKDIAEHKKAEESLRESEEKYSKAFLTAPYAITITRAKDGKFIEVNDTFTAITGFSREEATSDSSVGLKLWVDPEDRKRVVSALLKGSEVTGLECQFNKKNGDTLTGLISAQIINLRDELYILSSINDISRRKRLEAEKQKADARLETLSIAIEQSPVTTVITDAAGNIEFVNPKFTKITGYTSKEAIGQNPRILKGGDKPDSEYKELWDTILSGQDWHGVFQNKKKNGDLYWESAVISPVKNKNGIITHFLAVKEDISERKKAELEIKLKNEELLKLNTTKDKFFSIIAHDLRSPFNGFLGLTQLMTEKSSELTISEAQKMALIMRNSATNLYRLLENLLEWAQMQRGITSFHPESLLLQPKITESVALTLDNARKKEIEISYDCPKALKVLADVHMLETVIRNLISNAVKFTPKGGKITINAKQVPGNSVEISVKDTGIGMSPEMIDKLFRIDVQTNRKGTEGEPSTGLGLTICQDFIEKHGGKICVKSIEGKGSTFSFTIPMGDEL